MTPLINISLLILSLGLAASCLWGASHLAWYWVILMIWGICPYQ